MRRSDAPLAPRPHDSEAPAPGRLDRAGSSIVETIVALLILTTVITSLVAGSGWSSRSLVSARRDLQWWAALQWKADSLMSVDTASLAAGIDTVAGYPVIWNVQNGTQRTVEVVIGGAESILNAQALADTVVIYIGS